MANICQAELDRWQDRIDAWREAYDAVDNMFGDVVTAELAAAGVCGAAIKASVNLITGLVGGTACAVAIARLTQAVLAFTDGIDKTKDKAARGDEAAAAFFKCLADHKKDP